MGSENNNHPPGWIIIFEFVVAFGVVNALLSACSDSGSKQKHTTPPTTGYTWQTDSSWDDSVFYGDVKKSSSSGSTKYRSQSTSKYRSESTSKYRSSTSSKPASTYTYKRKKSSSKVKMPDCDDYEDDEYGDFMDDWDGNMPDGADAEDYWEDW